MGERMLAHIEGCNIMLRIIAIIAFVFVSSVSFAQEAAPTTAGPSYSDIQRTCGMEWRARTDKATNKGRDAWQTFLKECSTRKGYVSARARRIPAGFVPVPDKQ
jgi:hypothetical protein